MRHCIETTKLEVQCDSWKHKTLSHEQSIAKKKQQLKMRKNHTEINAFMEHFANEFHANDEKTKHHEQGNSKKNKTHSSAQSEQKSDDKKCQSDSETEATTVHTTLSLCQSSLKERTHTKKLNAIFFIYIHRHESRQEIV